MSWIWFSGFLVIHNGLLLWKIEKQILNRIESVLKVMSAGAFIMWQLHRLPALWSVYLPPPPHKFQPQ